MSHKPQLLNQSVSLPAKAAINLSQVSRISKQNGSALVIGVFIITVMFLLAAALINVLNDADQQISVEVWGTRALAAANSGADRSLLRLSDETSLVVFQLRDSKTGQASYSSARLMQQDGSG